jgi:hypothetical protein
MVGKPEVVVGRKRHVVSPRLPQDQVAVGIAESGRLGQIEEAQPRTGKPADDGQSVVGTPVGDDEQFKVGLASRESYSTSSNSPLISA